MLEDILTKQDSFRDVVLLWIEKMDKHAQTHSIQKYTNIAMQFMPLEKWMLNIKLFED